MKKVSLLKTMLLLCALVVGSSSVWATDITETFEGKTAATSYQGTVTVSTSESNCGIAWSIYYGCVSTNDKISGTKSAQMRWYGASAHVGNLPYIQTTTAIDGLSNVSLKARTSSTNVKMDVCYSANGTSWTVGKTHTFSATGTGENVSLTIPSGNKYVKFCVNSSSTAPADGSNFKLIVDDVVFTYTSDKETATWSLDPASASVNKGESTTLQLTTNYDGTLSFESEDTDIATVSYNSTTKVITVNGIAAGSTKITVTGDATSKYEAITKIISVDVTHSELASNFTDVISGLGYSYFGLTPSGSSTYVNLDDESISKNDVNGVGITFKRNGNSNTKLRFDGSYMRFYNGNSLTVTAPSGSYITKIIFTEPSSDKSWSGSMTTGSVGEYVSSEKTWYATVTGVTSVEFTSDATKRMGGMKIYLMVSSVPAIIASSSYSTLAKAIGLDFASATPAGLEAYVASDVSASGITLTAVYEAPASTGVILKGTAGTTYTIPVKADAAAVGTNYLKAAVSAYNCTANEVYILQSGLFHLVNAASTVPAGKAYLLASDISSAPEFLGFIFDDMQTTGVNDVRSKTADVRGDVFDLQGRKVANPKKGLYIVNGKKVAIK